MSSVFEYFGRILDKLLQSRKKSVAVPNFGKYWTCDFLIGNVQIRVKTKPWNIMSSTWYKVCVWKLWSKLNYYREKKMLLWVRRLKCSILCLLKKRGNKCFIWVGLLIQRLKLERQKEPLTGWNFCLKWKRLQNPWTMLSPLVASSCALSTSFLFEVGFVT